MTIYVTWFPSSILYIIWFQSKFLSDRSRNLNVHFLHLPDLPDSIFTICTCPPASAISFRSFFCLFDPFHNKPSAIKRVNAVTPAKTYIRYIYRYMSSLAWSNSSLRDSTGSDADGPKRLWVNIARLYCSITPRYFDIALCYVIAMIIFINIIFILFVFFFIIIFLFSFLFLSASVFGIYSAPDSHWNNITNKTTTKQQQCTCKLNTIGNVCYRVICITRGLSISTFSNGALGKYCLSEATVGGTHIANAKNYSCLTIWSLVN